MQKAYCKQYFQFISIATQGFFLEKTEELISYKLPLYKLYELCIEFTNHANSIKPLCYDPAEL